MNAKDLAHGGDRRVARRRQSRSARRSGQRGRRLTDSLGQEMSNWKRVSSMQRLERVVQSADVAGLRRAVEPVGRPEPA